MNRSGEWINNLTGDAQYRSFKPAALPSDPVLDISSDMVKKQVEANRELVKLDTASKLIPNVELFCFYAFERIKVLPLCGRLFR